MDTNYKILILSVIAFVLMAGVPLLGLISPKKSESLSDDLTLILNEEKLVFLEGNSLIPISDPSAPEPKVVRKFSVIVTAYSSTADQTDDDPYITAAGTWVRDGVIANNLLPFGTKVRLPEIYGNKVFVVEDRMNWKKGNYHFDVWFSSYWEAKDFGAKIIEIEILEG